jgi:hypothetical protein
MLITTEVPSTSMDALRDKPHNRMTVASVLETLRRLNENQIKSRLDQAKIKETVIDLKLHLNLTKMIPASQMILEASRQS